MPPLRCAALTGFGAVVVRPHSADVSLPDNLTIHLRAMQDCSFLPADTGAHVRDHALPMCGGPVRARDGACCNAGLAPIVPIRRSSSSQRPRRSRDAEGAAPQTPRRRRQKQPQPTLVIMPDGQGLCFAVRLPDGTSAKDSIPGQQETQSADSTAQQQQSVVVNVPDQQQHHDNSMDQPVGSLGTDAAGLQLPGTADVELGHMARHEEITLSGQPDQRPP